ncbi:MAG: TetR/AcrR family transcriptional regulator [Acidobacteria bacterium]|nr:TetR/AcrR family transcriptional regulator [Acidobacteriota bacterium]MBI3664588.1 TetR/AcrR family transcriptional regulator [Acidobacteriota bacterium]
MGRPLIRIPAGERRRQILAVATTLFARQGFQGTRTREISSKARVNEAILFRHFSSKEELYWAVLDEKCRARRGFVELQTLLRSGRPVPEVFSAIAEGLLRRNIQDSSILRLWLFSGLENHRLYRRFYRAYIADYYDLLAGYIRLQIRVGQFRRVDPFLAARGFLGMLLDYILTHGIFHGPRNGKDNLSRVSREMAELWLEGMQPRTRTERSRSDGSRAQRTSRKARALS